MSQGQGSRERHLPKVSAGSVVLCLRLAVPHSRWAAHSRDKGVDGAPSTLNRMVLGRGGGGGGEVWGWGEDWVEVCCSCLLFWSSG